MILMTLCLLKNTKINGISLFPFIFLKNAKDKNNKVLINHEKIHIRQQLELVLVFFYFLYLAEYFYWLLKYKNKEIAYRSISFEREAYTNENNLNYLKQRKCWSFVKFYQNKTN